jgi:fumarylacetoacetate (FAA) hydrolase
MKLATLKSNTRDGKLVVVDKELHHALAVPGVPTMQAALDDWKRCEPMLKEAERVLLSGDSRAIFQLDPNELESPLPRSYHWADCSAYVNHVELVRKARGAELPKDFWTNPLIYQGGSDDFCGPRDAIVAADVAHGVDFEAEVVVVLGDTPMGVSEEEAASYIRLVMLCNDVSLRNLIPGELRKGFGFYQSKPATAFSPVAVTLDELGPSWDGGKINLPLNSSLNGKHFGAPHAGTDMTFEFPRLIAHAAKTRNLRAGTLLGSGTVSNLDRSKGSSCLAERRMLEILEHGEAKTPFMQVGDSVRIEMFDEHSKSIFGAIEQKVEKAEEGA